MKSSIEIYNLIREENDRIAADSAAFNGAEGDERAAIHDRIVASQGRVSVYNDMLADSLKAEDEVRAAGGVPKAASHEQAMAEAAPADVADLFLGTREEFAGSGFLASMGGRKVTYGIDVLGASDPTHGLVTPTRQSFDLPDNAQTWPNGVLDTIARGTTDANMTYFVQGEFTNNAADWTPGKTKAESAESWDKDTMNLFVTAHWIPVNRNTANHYGQLQALIKNDLLVGLGTKLASDVLLHEGTNEEGILNKSGIQEYAVGTAGAKKGEGIMDSIRRARYASWRATGIQPDFVAVHPLALVELDLKKLSDGQYMSLMINGKLWMLPVVEDMNLEATTGDGDSAVTKYGALVYNHRAATLFTSEENSVTLGLVHDQFIKNEYTLLAEGEHGVMVSRPKSFVHIADAINPLA